MTKFALLSQQHHSRNVGSLFGQQKKEKDKKGIANELFHDFCFHGWKHFVDVGEK